MAKTDEPTVIKKYANRRLYNTGTSTYVTLEDLAEMVKAEDDFVVFDAKSGDDITRSVLTQIIFEQENKGQNLLPIAFLRQLIRFYGDSMQTLVPPYLEYSLESFVRDQEKMRQQMASTFGVSPFDTLDEHVRRNTQMFEQAMRMFMPFGPGGEPQERPAEAGEEKPAAAGSGSGDLDDMKRQLAEMQRQLNTLATGSGGPKGAAKKGGGSSGA
ncbi:polyhydroxyalkanoate synthesis repressor PhaR [Amorphus orientalis]|uniref:Polyhydroxyalkanoate synthesis repressor PhaR n=1 Tax=Amorphus orientalis TaxID=649198 RepID=A0AAE4ASI2_9HYPH|nr:polyhydroxyalkanoate synthesis repressor PhaR [Amorphus orientalis]MDQ0315147.1 polyhydroxyalkanoate synthesis repressor PhaR [Amorphus orientalis]